jgi:hypothetical protein
MFLDALLKVSAAQAFGAAAVSTNSIDLALLTPGRQIGTGEPMGFGLSIDVAPTVAPPIIDIISATDAALTAGILVHASFTRPIADLPAGTLLFLPLPQGTPTQRFLGIRITTAGGTITASAWLTTHSLFSLIPRSYPKGFTV